MRTNKKGFLALEICWMSLVVLAFAFRPSNVVAEETTPPVVTEPAPTPSVAPVPVVVPEGVLKADFVGSDTCLTCHADQASFSSSPHGKGFPKLKGIAADKSCETCHGPGSLHAEAAGDKTNPGFASINNMKGDVSSSCFQCHQDQKRLHWNSSTHKNRNVSCASCHSVHAAKSKKTLLKAVDEKSLCFQCHQDIKAQSRRSSHMPIAEGKMSCSDCHNPHGSPTSKMIAADNVTQLCYKCHAEKRGPFLWEHPPVRENCLTCHAAHGSHHDKMLNTKQPFLCQRCHNATRHPSTAYSASDLATGNSRVFNQSCYNCHSNIHGSNHPSGKFFQR